MNQPHDPTVTADIPPVPTDSFRAADPLRTTDHVRSPDSTVDSCPAAPPGADASAGDLPAVPGYRVRCEIARGGMGKVLAAFDLNLDRDVALKILLPGANADRFVRESKITARLPHPGIPPVHALGTLADGSPFLAMKLIAGQTLADEMKTADRPRLLQAFTQVCQAVGFAHSRGVIHRDLKPTNVMVGAFGEVQVMDWGLAKDLSRQGDKETRRQGGESEPSVSLSPCLPVSLSYALPDHTEAGTVLGTPAYMAPEQARGEATDARGDVFALGGILCAILTGRPPFRGNSRLEVIRRAATADLAEANGRLDGCGADAELVAVCRRCLSPNPVDRPANGQAVADGLTTYLNGVQKRLQEAERARAVAVAREAEQRKRRRVQLALAAAVVVLLVGGAAFMWRHYEQRGRNAEAVAGLLDQGEMALRANDVAKATVLLDAARKRSAEGGAEKQAERLAWLSADLALLSDLDDIDQFRWIWGKNKFSDPVAVATRTREALTRFGADPDTLSADDAAARVAASVVQERIVPALDRLLREQKTAGVRALLRRVDADPYRDAVRDAVLADDRAKVAELAGQEDALEQPPGFAAFLGESPAMKIERRRQLLAAAVSRQPGNLGLLMALGSTYLDHKDGVSEALRWYQAAVAAAPANYAAHINLGCTLADKGQLVEAIACYRKAIVLDRKKAQAHYNLALAQEENGQVDEAIASYRKAIELDPQDAKALGNLGIILCDVKRDYDGAIDCAQKAIALEPQEAKSHCNLGVALDGKGHVDEAIECYRKAIILDPKLANAHCGLGVALNGKGEGDEAIACFRKAVEIDPKSAIPHVSLGNALHDKGRLDEAIECYRKAIILDPKNAWPHNGIGNAMLDKGQLDEAIECYRKAIALNPKFANPHNGLGDGLKDKGQLDEAIECYRKAIALDPKYTSGHNGLANALYDKGKVDEAIEYYRKAIALDPKFANPYNGLGNALKSKGQVDEAIACYRKAIELDPKSAIPHFNLGTILRKVKRDYDGAIASYGKAIELDPTDAAAHYGLGVAWNGKGQVDEAIACYRKAIELDPKYTHAHNDLGNALSDKAQLDEAIACYRKAIALDPKYAYPHNGLGNALKRKGHFDEAIACYREAIKLDPKYTNAHNGLGNALSDKGQLDEAIACYRKAIELDAKYAWPHNGMGNALKRKGQLDEAIACYHKAIELDPKLALVHTNLGNTLVEKGRTDEAIVCYRKAIELDPKYNYAHNGLGNALSNKGQLDEAIECYRQAIALDPKYANAHNGLGNALKRKGQLNEAIACYRKAIELDPKYNYAHTNLGNALAEQGQIDEAIACFKKAIELDPKDAEPHCNLGVALVDKGQVDEAIACFKKAVELDPKDADLHCILGHAQASQGRFAESLAAFKRGHELGTKQPGWCRPSAEWVRRAEANVAMEAKLPAFLKGEFQPSNNKERQGLAEVCQGKKLYQTAVGLYATVFAADPKRADDLEAGLRYDAARSAALASAGWGEDVGKHDAKERTRLRRQARDWLHADLALRRKQLEADKPADRAAVQQALRHWQQDTDLAGLRDAVALAKLPADEQKECTQLWADVAALLKQAEEKPK